MIMTPVPHANPALKRLVEGVWLRRAQSIALTLGVSSLIALLLWLLQGRAGLTEYLLISNSIGFWTWGIAQLTNRVSGGRHQLLGLWLVAVPLGVVLGAKTAARLGAFDLLASWSRNPSSGWQSLSVPLLFTASAAAAITAVTSALEFRMELEVNRRRSVEAARSQAVAELALLQAQIEPHFLFNTLAHVQSAIDLDPALGKTTLEHLIRYLRGSLQRTRLARFTLGDEQELVESLLAIARIRLGDRLRYAVRFDESLRAVELPPLLLQPLVENAIRHGIEPAVDGGSIDIEAARSGEMLLLRVSDTGVGMAATSPESVGLANVRARLASLHGERGHLALLANRPTGVIAELRIPYQAPPRDAT